MGQPLSIEDPTRTYFITTRTAEARLWLIKNQYLETRILSCLARCQDIHGAIIYAFILMGNHYHLIANFPRANRARFMRDFNSAVARLVGRYVGAHGRRAVWARRYAQQVLGCDEDITHWFLYAAANPVSSGLVEDINEYRSYNSFYDNAAMTVRNYPWIDWSQYLVKKRSNPLLSPDECTRTYQLKYSKIPEFENVPDTEYSSRVHQLLKAREKLYAEERRAAGRGFMGRVALFQQRIGSRPVHSKQSIRASRRPIVLTLFRNLRLALLKQYYLLKDQYIKSSKEYRESATHVRFPSGSYPPPRLAACH